MSEKKINKNYENKMNLIEIYYNCKNYFNSKDKNINKKKFLIIIISFIILIIPIFINLKNLRKNKKNSRLLIYVINNEYNNVSSYIFYQLNHINHLFSKIIIISNSEIKKSNKLINIINKTIFIYQKTIFSKYEAWYKAILNFGFLNLIKYDEITFMTDECYGPFWEIDEYFINFEKEKEVDFWGIISFKNKKIIDYFITFKSNIIKNKIFIDFWNNEKLFKKNKIINISKYFLNKNFKYKTIYNIDYLYEDEFIELLIKKIPFFIISDLNFNSTLSFFFLEKIYKYTNYPIDNILFHLSKFINPDNINILPFKYLKKVENKNLKKKKIAIHLHIFYPELLKDFIYYFHENIKYNFDLYITTDNLNKKDIITENLKHYKSIIKFNFNYYVIITLNKGRDIYPMVQIKKYLSKYDYIGHFHDKRSPINYYLTESWTKDIMYMMINCTNNIISNFIKNDELGIVIADVPSLFRYKKFIEKDYDEKLLVYLDNIWNNLKIKKKFKINDNKTFIFSYGTYLWFKYDALRPFFNINEKDIPNEPLGRLTSLHLIERIFIYIAWSQNYDFKISPNLIQIPAFLNL